MAQIATARVTASMAAAERAPWAGVVRPRSGSGLAAANGNQTPAPAPAAVGVDRQSSRQQDDSRPAFEPRPLPSGGDPSLAARVRKLPAPPVRPQGGTAPVILPAPRPPSPPQEPLPAERPKRRRLRSR